MTYLLGDRDNAELTTLITAAMAEELIAMVPSTERAG
jgi:hypothetical protein